MKETKVSPAADFSPEQKERKEGSQEGGKDWSFLSRDRLSIDWLELGIYEELVRKEKPSGEDNLNPVQKFDPKDKSKINMIWAVEAQVHPLILLFEEQVKSNLLCKCWPKRMTIEASSSFSSFLEKTITSCITSLKQFL